MYMLELCQSAIKLCFMFSCCLVQYIDLITVVGFTLEAVVGFTLEALHGKKKFFVVSLFIYLFFYFYISLLLTQRVLTLKEMPTYVVFCEGLAAAPKKHKQKSNLFFCISLELFNNALFGQEILVGLGRRLSSSAILLTWKETWDWFRYKWLFASWLKKISKMWARQSRCLWVE